MHFDLFYRISLVLNIDDSGLQPSRKRMIRIHPIVNNQSPAWLPLREYSFRVDADVLIKLGRPSRVVNIELITSNEDYLAIDPLLRQIPRIHVLAQLELHCLRLHPNKN